MFAMLEEVQTRFVAYNITYAGHNNNNPFIRFLFEQSDI